MNDSQQKLVLDALERMRAKISTNIEALGLRATGKTQASMRVEATATGGRLVGRGYFQSLELGRPAGAVPANFVAIIKEWIVAKGLAPIQRPYKTDRQHKYSVEERSLNFMAAAVANKIRREGYKPWRNGGYVDPPAADVYSPVLAEGVADLKKAIAINVIKQLAIN